jgi:hypothetical protein
LRTAWPPAEPKSLFGYMTTTMTINGDVVAPRGELRSAVSGTEDLLYGAVDKKPRARPRLG